MKERPEKSPYILYMDDDQDDVELLQVAFGSIDSRFTLLTAADGEQGLALLEEQKEVGNLPRLIVLDINMPRMDGRLTFKKIREDHVLAPIPIVVFSTSSNIMDKLFFGENHVEYITKPIQFEHLVMVAKRLLSYVKE